MAEASSADGEIRPLLRSGRLAFRNELVLGLTTIPTGWYGSDMVTNAKSEAAQASSDKLLDAAVHVIRSKGYSAARVEDICAEAGLTKGAFFHHFASKEACAIAAAAHFAANADAVFDAAPYSRLPDARARVLGYVDFRKAILQGELPQFTCLLGTMVQEAYDFASRHSRRLRPLHQRARRAARKGPRRGQGALRPGRRMDAKKRRALFTGCPPGRLHSGQG